MISFVARPGLTGHRKFLSTNIQVDYTRVVQLPGITCTNVKNRYEDSRETCVRREILSLCPSLHTGPVFANELELMNQSKNADLIFPSHKNQEALEYKLNCVSLADNLRFGKCYELTESIQYYEFSPRMASPRSSNGYFHILKGVETLVEYSLKLDLRDYIIELLSIFATTYGWSVFTLRSIAKKRIKYIVLRKLVKYFILTIAMFGLIYQFIGLMTDYAKYESRTELRLLKTDRHLQLPFFDICSDCNSSLNSTANSLGYYQVITPKTVYFNGYIVCQRHQLLAIDSKDDSYDINAMIVKLTVTPQPNTTLSSYLDITMDDQVLPTYLRFPEYNTIKAMQRYRTQL